MLTPKPLYLLDLLLHVCEKNFILKLIFTYKFKTMQHEMQHEITL